MQGPLDWDDLRVLLAVREAGSFAGAARRLRVDGATVGRRMRALEGRLGASLFERTPGRLAPTAAGARALAAAARMDDAAVELARALEGAAVEVGGTLRIAATETLAARVLALRLGPLLAAHPAPTVELVTGPARASLARREADVAVRLARPDEPAVVARRAGTVAFALYRATPARPPGPARRSAVRPAGTGALAAIGYADALVERSDVLGWAERLPGARVVLRCDDALAALEAARAGLGVAALPCFLADAEPGLERAAPDLRTRELWLAVHAELHRSPRARVALRFLGDALAEARPALEGTRAEHPPRSRG